MTPPSMSDLRRQLWRARVNAAALVAPHGLTVAQGALPPGQGRAVTESELRNAYTAARAAHQSIGIGRLQAALLERPSARWAEPIIHM